MQIGSVLGTHSTEGLREADEARTSQRTRTVRMHSGPKFRVSNRLRLLDDGERGNPLRIKAAQKPRNATRYCHIYLQLIRIED